MAAPLQLKPLTLFVDPGISLIDGRLRGLLAYWNEKRGARPMPARADISPGEMVTRLPRIALLNVLGEGQTVADFNVRLSGTGIDDLLGRDFRGTGLSDLLAEGPAKLIAAALAALVQHKRPMRFFAHAHLPGHPDAHIEGIALPLGPEGGSVNMVLLETVLIRQSDKASFPELRGDGLAAVGF